MIGCLGDILFEVNSDKIQTPDNIQWSGSARYSEHRRHLINALTEFTGIDTDKFSLRIVLSKENNVDVLAELGKIWIYERKGTPLSLVFGDKGYGKYKWTINKHRATMKYFDGKGNLTTAEVSLNLLEYLNS